MEMTVSERLWQIDVQLHKIRQVMGKINASGFGYGQHIRNVPLTRIVSRLLVAKAKFEGRWEYRSDDFPI